MPLSSTALRSRSNKTFQTGCVTKYNVIKTCVCTIDGMYFNIDDIFPVWTHDFSHVQICDCVDVCLFLENMLARQILWLAENSNHSFLSPCWVTEHDPCHWIQYTQSKYKLNLKFCCCVYSRTMSCRHMMMNCWPWHCQIMRKIILIFKGTNCSDLMVANNFLECSLLFLQYHKWPSEVARITKPNPECQVRNYISAKSLYLAVATKQVRFWSLDITFVLMT
jgi:hypothetical protein